MLAVPDPDSVIQLPWKPEVAWRLTPFLSPLDMSSTFQPYDRPSVIAGPFIDSYSRGGFKVGIQEAPQGSQGPKVVPVALPDRFRDPQKSGATYTITPSTTQLDIDLK